MSELSKVPDILADGDKYDEVAELMDKQLRKLRVAESLVAAGMTLIPCRPYDPIKYNAAREKFLEVGKSKMTKDELKDLNHHSGKCPSKANPYGYDRSGNQVDSP